MFTFWLKLLTIEFIIFISWAEQNPREILDSVLECIRHALANLPALGFNEKAVVGIVNYCVHLSHSQNFPLHFSTFLRR